MAGVDGSGVEGGVGSGVPNKSSTDGRSGTGSVFGFGAAGAGVAGTGGPNKSSTAGVGGVAGVGSGVGIGSAAFGLAGVVFLGGGFFGVGVASDEESGPASGVGGLADRFVSSFGESTTRVSSTAGAKVGSPGKGDVDGAGGAISITTPLPISIGMEVMGDGEPPSQPESQPPHDSTGEPHPATTGSATQVGAGVQTGAGQTGVQLGDGQVDTTQVGGGHAGAQDGVAPHDFA